MSAILPDALGGFWVGTAENGLIHLLKNGDLESFNSSNSSIPSNKIVALHLDALNNIKVGYSLDEGWGIATPNLEGYWESLIEYKQDGLLNNEIRSLARDKSGKLWIKTADDNQIHYLTADRLIKTLRLNEPADSDLLHVDIFDNIWFSSNSGLVRYTPKGEWKTFDLTSFGAANNDIYGMTSDAEGNLWISVYTDSNQPSEVKILRKFVDEHWEILNTKVFQEGSGRDLQIDSDGELWVLERGVLTGDVEIHHRFADSKWETFTEKETGVSHMEITTLHVTASKELWIGSSGSIVHRTSDGKWAEILTTSFRINTIYSDDMGGLWVGTGLDYNGVGGGLMYRQPDGNWFTFNTSNSGLTGNYITSLVSDGSGGVWVGTLLNGLHHLTFGTASQIIQNSDSYKGLGAAIIIAGGGSDKENQLWNATASISNRIYKMLKKRGFDNSQIYYLSPQSYGDFDGDGLDDCIVDAPATPRCQMSTVEHPIKERPLKSEDVRQALAWAESRGKLDQPLYLFFLDHGVPEKLMLSKGEFMKADAFKPMLDQYQKNTSNELILVIDACHSGSFVEHLAAPNRAIISSAKAEEKAAFVEKEGFSRFLAKGLESNRSFFEAFEYAAKNQEKMLGKRLRFSDRSGITSQTPQLDDNGDGIFNEKDGQQLGQVRIGGNVVFGNITLTVETHTASTTLQAGQPMTLKAKASSAVGELKRVWAVLRPPKMNFVLDTYGTPILAFPRLKLSPTTTEDIWETTWHDAIYNGDYEISFYAEDNEGDIASSDTPLIISVIGGVAPPAQAQVQIVLDKDSYRLGEPLKAELIEDLGWGYDLYAAVLLPGGSEFIALKTTNLTAQANQPQKWLSARTQNSPVRLLDLTLPTDLSVGQYCLYGILSPEKEAVLETKRLWVMAKRCFNVLPCSGFPFPNFGNKARSSAKRRVSNQKSRRFSKIRPIKKSAVLKLNHIRIMG
ncbi:MAG: two-component regulator propeller domain-containing protein, partial [Candidatus Parabeggiatoa sp.]|nr:two-component regulator propeller domain-containing protein [Candidatus Parabeggiatoa sp.]